MQSSNDKEATERQIRYQKLSRATRNGEADSHSMQSLPSTKRRPRGRRKYRLADHRSTVTEPARLPSGEARISENGESFATTGVIELR